MLSLLGPGGRVVGVDVDIRPHNRDAIERHPLANRIQLIQGSSTDPAVVNQVNDAARSASRVLVLLDSNHTHEHVLQELRQYSPLVKAGSYLVVYDTAIEDMPADAYPDRPWGKGNNPKTAVWEFLRSNDRFVIDEQVEQRLMFTVAPDGYLRCVRDS
jgi:cephalosporin hydroxylase